MQSAITKPLFNLCLLFGSINFNLANSEMTYEDLISTPVNQLEFRVLKLNHLLNHKTKGIVRSFEFSFSTHFDGLEYSTAFSKNFVQVVDCYIDVNNPFVIVCEIIFEDHVRYENIQEKIKIIKHFYSEIIDKSRSVILSSLNLNNIKVVMKIEKPNNEKAEEFLCYENENISNPFSPSKFLTLSTHEETWVIWENGNPYYQDAFFEESVDN